MVPDIAYLANAVSQRNVRTRTMPPNTVHMTHPKRGDCAPTLLYTIVHWSIELHRLRRSRFTHFLVGSLCPKRNLQIHNVQELNNFVGNEYQDVSPDEAVAVKAVVQSFLFKIAEQHFLQNL